ncbi:oligopeptide transporter, OPT family, partial [Salmonella enterica subsp. enterica serovar Heidelberg]|nr:oligopeptide transporter, OPT family [Salmonella enterica subsp. enterica serovar Heidelberg]
PYPEGVAAAEVLKVGSASGAGDRENAAGLRTLIAGTIFSGLFALLAKMKLVAEEAGKNFAIGGTATGWSTSWSMLLIGVGHLVGISVGAAM